MSLFSVVRTISQQADVYQPVRTAQSIVGNTVSELGEVAIEVNIEAGHSYKKPSEDGVVGEAVDTILCLLDLIYKHSPNITEEELEFFAVKKGSKWISKLKEHTANARNQELP